MAFFKANQILLKENIPYPILSKAYQHAVDHIQREIMSLCSVHNFLLKMVSRMELEIGRGTEYISIQSWQFFIENGVKHGMTD